MRCRSPNIEHLPRGTIATKPQDAHNASITASSSSATAPPAGDSDFATSRHRRELCKVRTLAPSLPHRSLQGQTQKTTDGRRRRPRRDPAFLVTIVVAAQIATHPQASGPGPSSRCQLQRRCHQYGERRRAPPSSGPEKPEPEVFPGAHIGDGWRGQHHNSKAMAPADVTVASSGQRPEAWLSPITASHHQPPTATRLNHLPPARPEPARIRQRGHHG